MEDWGLGPHGNSVSIRMGTAQAPVCVGHVHVTALVLAAEVAAVKGPGLRSQIAQGTSFSIFVLFRKGARVVPVHSFAPSLCFCDHVVVFQPK